MSPPQTSKDDDTSSIGLRRKNARRDPSASYLERRQRLLDAAAEVIKDKGLEATSVNEPSTVRLRRLLRAALEAYERHYPIVFLYIQEDMRRVPGDGTEAGAELQELGRRYESALGKITRDGVDAGEFHTDLDDSLLKFAILGAMNWTHRWFVPGGRLTGAEVGEAFADYFLQGVRRSRQRRGTP